MNIIGKNKAPSYDGMTDIIFQKKTYTKIKYGTYLPNKNKEELDYHTK